MVLDGFLLGSLSENQTFLHRILLLTFRLLFMHLQASPLIVHHSPFLNHGDCQDLHSHQKPDREGL